jgi:hypothetical protein
LISFRTAEDERRYLALRNEMVLRLAASCPAPIAHEILRNLGKLEAFVFVEGVRQGAIATDLNALATEGVEDASPLMAHAVVYSGSDTPLTRCERGLLERCGMSPSAVDAYLSAALFNTSATQFAPTTLAEAQDAYGPMLMPLAPESPRPAQAPRPVPRRNPDRDDLDDLDDLDESPGLDESPPTIEGTAEITEGALFNEDDLTDATATKGTIAALEALLSGDPDAAELLMEVEGRAAKLMGDVARHADGTMPFAAPEIGDVPFESPDLLDRVRDQLIALQKTDWKPAAWGEMIYKLHITMGIDAGYLDLQLSSSMGRTVVAQAGLLNLDPGLGAIFTTDGRLEATT